MLWYAFFYPCTTRIQSQVQSERVQPAVFSRLFINLGHPHVSSTKTCSLSCFLPCFLIFIFIYLLFYLFSYFGFSNAVKFTPPGGKVTITLTFTEPLAVTTPMGGAGWPPLTGATAGGAANGVGAGTGVGAVTSGMASGMASGIASGVAEVGKGGQVLVSVADSGPGLNAAQLQQLFSEGVQFNANTLQVGWGDCCERAERRVCRTAVWS